MQSSPNVPPLDLFESSITGGEMLLPRDLPAPGEKRRYSNLQQHNLLGKLATSSYCGVHIALRLGRRP